MTKPVAVILRYSQVQVGHGVGEEGLRERGGDALHRMDCWFQPVAHVLCPAKTNGLCQGLAHPRQGRQSPACLQTFPPGRPHVARSTRTITALLRR
jgi:hypothetical protein